MTPSGDLARSKTPAGTSVKPPKTPKSVAAEAAAAQQGIAAQESIKDACARVGLDPKYRKVTRLAPAACDTMDTEDNEIWLISLPRQVHLQRLGGLEAQLSAAVSESGHMGSFRDATGATFVLSQDDPSLGAQLAVSAKCAGGWSGKLPCVRRVTVHRDLSGGVGDAGGDGTGALLTSEQLYSDILFVGQPDQSTVRLGSAAVAPRPYRTDAAAGEKKDKKRKKDKSRTEATEAHALPSSPPAVTPAKPAAAAAAAPPAAEPAAAGPGPGSEREERKSSKKRARAELEAQRQALAAADAAAQAATAAAATAAAAAAAATPEAAKSSKKHKHKKRERADGDE